MINDSFLMPLTRAWIGFEKEDHPQHFLLHVQASMGFFFCSLLPPAENVSASNLIISLLLFSPAVGIQIRIIVWINFRKFQIWSESVFCCVISAYSSKLLKYRKLYSWQLSIQVIDLHLANKKKQTTFFFSFLTGDVMQLCTCEYVKHSLHACKMPCQ